MSSRVLGPYPSGKTGYRLVVILDTQDLRARRKALVFRSREEAIARKAELEREGLALFDLRQGLREYIDGLAARGVQHDTCLRTEQQLARFLPLQQPIGSITSMDAKRLYARETQRLKPNGRPIAVDTHHLLLRRAKQFFAWLIATGYRADNPFADIKPVGRPRRGKLQLRIDEARRFVDAAMRQAQVGHPVATAALLQVYLGLRPTEALVRVVRDLDDDGQILWVPHGKTPNARRRLAVPPELRPLLLAQACGKPQDAPLLGPPGEPCHTRHALRYVLRKLCQEAGVPQVCPHSLRGLAATLAVQAGALSADVARALGHASFATTARHYTDASTLANAQLQQVTQTLRGRR